MRDGMISLMVDTKNDIKRTYFLPPSLDVKIKVTAAEEGLKQSDVVRTALEMYFAQKKDKRK
jgi:hypothetical protein